jgi:hypothetical protein
MPRRRPPLPLRVRRRRRSSTAGTRVLPAVGLVAVLSGCASSSQVLSGTPRAALTTERVIVYTQPPPKFEEIAQFGASRTSVSAAAGERAIAKMIADMRICAARLGANGLLLEDFTEIDSIALAAGAGTQSYTHNGSISLGVGAMLGFQKKVARARAIFVQPPS